MTRNTLKASFGALAIAGLFTLSSCHPDETPTPTPTPALTDYCGDVNAATTWTNNREGVDYRVSCVFTINSDMVIEAGTEIEFKDGAGIIIGNAGSLKVMGASGNMVMMHGTTLTAGSWKGLWFQSNDDNNSLNYCTISGGGQGSFNGHDIKANVRLSLTGKLGIVNSTISLSGRDGLYIEGNDADFLNPLRTFANNTFSNNGKFPVTTIASTINTMDGTASAYTANGNQHIEIRGGNVYGLHSWEKNSIPFLVSGEIRSGYFSEGGQLTINEGVIMEFINDFGITTGEYSTTSFLRMVGTVDEPVILRSGDGDSWQGVCFQSMHAQNLLSYVIIDKGGSVAFTGSAAKKGNVVIGGFSAGDATIQNCNIRNSAAYGIFVAMGSSTPTVTGTTYSGNTLANYYVE